MPGPEAEERALEAVKGGRVAGPQSAPNAHGFARVSPSVVSPEHRGRVIVAPHSLALPGPQEVLSKCP